MTRQARFVNLGPGLVGKCMGVLALIGCAGGGAQPAANPAASAAVAAAERNAKLPPLIEREIFFEDPEISGGQISPDGKYITFRRPYKGVLNVWVKQREQPFEAARPITADTKRPVGGYFWTEDSKYVLYVQDKGGDENYRIYAVDPAAPAEAATGVPVARDLTPYKDVRAQIIDVPEPLPGKLIVALNDRDPKMHDVYRLDIATGKRELMFKNEASIVGWTVDYTGKLRLAQRLTPDGGTELLRIDGNKLSRVYECSQLEECGAFRFHKDGRRVYMTTNKGPDTDLSQLVLFDPASRKEELIESDPEKQVDFGGVVFSDVTEELVATVYEGDRERIYPRDGQFQRDYDIIKKSLPDGDISFISATDDERYRLVAITSDRDPGAVYLYDRAAGRVDLLYRPRPKLPVEHLAAMKPVRYTARDGVSIPAYLTVPKGSDGKNLPTIINPHGGPWARDTWGYDPMAQFLANRGYAVLQPNFRGSTNYGKKFLNLGNKQWGTGTMQHDLTDAAKWLAAEGIADGKKIAILGGSYGGYATLAGLAFTPDVYAAGVDIVGPSSIPTLLASIPPYWAPLKKLFAVRVGDIDDPTERKMLEAQSPLNFAKNIKAPLLVIQGANDPRVKQAESDQIVVAMRDAGRPVEYLVAADEGHGFRGQENRLAMFAAIEAFLAKHLGGRAQQGMAPPVAQRLAGLTMNVQKVALKPVVAAPVATAAATFTGASLKPAKFRYAFKGETMGKPIEGTSTLTIASARHEGKPVWSIAEESKTSLGTGSDKTLVDRKTLMPVDRMVKQGATSIELAFTATEVSGKMKAVGQEMPIKAKVDGAVLSDGAPLHLALATLPLADGYRSQIQSFEIVGGKAKKHAVTVAGSEDVKIPAGTFAAWRVQITPEEPGDGAATVWIEKAGGKRVLKWERTLPGAMGGGKLGAELLANP